MELALCEGGRALWHSVIKSKYVEEAGGWRSCEVGRAYGVDVLKAVKRPTLLKAQAFRIWV